MGPITEEVLPNMALPAIRSKYPLGDRMALALSCCCKSLAPVDVLRANPATFQFTDEFKLPFQQDLGLKIGVKETGYLQLDPCVVHPFVRVHIVDLKTGKYLAKREPLKPGVTNKEHVSLIDSEGHITTKNVDFLLPMSTKFFDMRIRGHNACEWQEEFIVNEAVSYIC